MDMSSKGLARNRYGDVTPENAFLCCFDHAIELTAQTLLDSGMKEEDVWAALIHSVDTLKTGIETINATQFAGNEDFVTGAERDVLLQEVETH